MKKHLISLNAKRIAALLVVCAVVWPVSQLAAVLGFLLGWWKIKRRPQRVLID